MDGLLHVLEEREIQCTGCEKTAHLRSFVLKDTKPHKIITVIACTNCGLSETTEDDYVALDYGVRITCDFMKGNREDLRRMAFINSRAEAAFYANDPEGEMSEIFSFSAEKSNIDCIEGLMMRGDEVLSAGKGDKNINDRCHRLKKIMDGSGFKMVITDNTGYSRVCPVGMEYTEIQDLSLEDISRMDPQVLHEKVPKKE